jgi:hypothetical protein
MDGASYDLFLMLMEDYELRKHKAVLESAQRLERHHGFAGDDYVAELEAVEAELKRRAMDPDWDHAA